MPPGYEVVFCEHPIEVADGVDFAGVRLRGRVDLSLIHISSARQLEKLHDELASAGAESFVCLVPRLSCLRCV